MNNEEVSNGFAKRLWQVNQALIPLVAGGLVSFIVWTGKQINNLEKSDIRDHAEIKEWVRNNYPSEDMVRDIKEIRKDIETIKVELAKNSN